MNVLPDYASWNDAMSISHISDHLAILNFLWLCNHRTICIDIILYIWVYVYRCNNSYVLNNHSWKFEQGCNTLKLWRNLKETLSCSIFYILIIYGIFCEGSTTLEYTIIIAALPAWLSAGDQETHSNAHKWRKWIIAVHYSLTSRLVTKMGMTIRKMIQRM